MNEVLLVHGEIDEWVEPCAGHPDQLDGHKRHLFIGDGGQAEKEEHGDGRARADHQCRVQHLHLLALLALHACRHRLVLNVPHFNEKFVQFYFESTL